MALDYSNMSHGILISQLHKFLWNSFQLVGGSELGWDSSYLNQGPHLYLQLSEIHIDKVKDGKPSRRVVNSNLGTSHGVQ